MSTTKELENIEPQTAVQMYLQEKGRECTEWTVYSHDSRLSHFIEWCDSEGIQNLNDLTGRDLHRYKLWRGEDINKVTLKTQMDTLRVFIRFCERIDAVTEDLSESVLSPNITKEENSKDEMLDKEVAEKILSYVDKYDYATNKHVTLILMWRTGMRVGAIHALDVDDYDSEGQYIHPRHRPETGTGLKNKQAGERYISLSSETCAVLNDYIEDQRHNVTDDSGRAPLIATAHGRPHTTTLRKWTYIYTQPCSIGADCPHGRDPETCEANNYDKPYQCPSSRSPHAVRRGAITSWLQNDTPPRAVSDRVNSSEEVIEQHYDERTEIQKMKQRRQYFDSS
ncbi:tyrosine-type recombinase/integrase [Halorubrum depositum]|jgi:site-specific recombinase XerD|uniref:tyrosine-type recombinase/integrase n=1 Tax=Halorubrum depositum TaxID=2583992 RepID=UPI0011A2BDBF|nr:site-specific integrase [Halorubrum depositum]